MPDVKVIVKVELVWKGTKREVEELDNHRKNDIELLSSECNFIIPEDQVNPDMFFMEKLVEDKNSILHNKACEVLQQKIEEWVRKQSNLGQGVAYLAEVSQSGQLETYKCTTKSLIFKPLKDRYRAEETPQLELVSHKFVITRCLLKLNDATQPDKKPKIIAFTHETDSFANLRVYLTSRNHMQPNQYFGSIDRKIVIDRSTESSTSIEGLSQITENFDRPDTNKADQEIDNSEKTANNKVKGAAWYEIVLTTSAEEKTPASNSFSKEEIVAARGAVTKNLFELQTKLKEKLDSLRDLDKDNKDAIAAELDKVFNKGIEDRTSDPSLQLAQKSGDYASLAGIQRGYFSLEKKDRDTLLADNNFHQAFVPIPQDDKNPDIFILSWAYEKTVFWDDICPAERKPRYSSYRDNLYTYSSSLHENLKSGLKRSALDISGSGFVEGVTIGGSYEQQQQEERTTRNKDERVDVYLLSRLTIPKVELLFPVESLNLCPNFVDRIRRIVEQTDTKEAYKALVALLDRFGYYVATEYVLGGEIYIEDIKHLESQADTEKVVQDFAQQAGASLDAAKIGVQVGYSRSESNTTGTANNQQNQQRQITAQVRGGACHAAGDPGEWISSLDYWQYWHVVRYGGLVPILALLKEVDLRRRCIKLLYQQSSQDTKQHGLSLRNYITFFKQEIAELGKLQSSDGKGSKESPGAFVA